MSFFNSDSDLATAIPPPALSLTRSVAETSLVADKTRSPDSTVSRTSLTTFSASGTPTWIIVFWPINAWVRFVMDEVLLAAGRSNTPPEPDATF